MQRVVFLHEELIKIGSFPRKALEADLDLYKGGEMGKVRIAYRVFWLTYTVTYVSYIIYHLYVDFENMTEGITRFGRAS